MDIIQTVPDIMDIIQTVLDIFRKECPELFRFLGQFFSGKN